MLALQVPEPECIHQNPCKGKLTGEPLELLTSQPHLTVKLQMRGPVAQVDGVPEDGRESCPSASAHTHVQSLKIVTQQRWRIPIVD